MTRPYTTISKLSGSALKRIAVITMFGDHFAASIVLLIYYQARSLDLSVSGVSASTWIIIYYALRGFGRIAFPIFCFFLVEGFCHTSNTLKYMLRLGIFAIISEIPFDLTLNNSPDSSEFVFLEFSYQNVFFTLFIAFVVLWAAEKISGTPLSQPEKLKKYDFSTAILKCIFLIIISLPFAALAEYVLMTDYGGLGVFIIIFIMCGKILGSAQKKYFGEIPIFETGFGAAALIVGCFLTANAAELLALIGFALCLFYNGERGKGNKWFFYIFYPAHLLVLGLICLLIRK